MSTASPFIRPAPSRASGSDGWPRGRLVDMARDPEEIREAAQEMAIPSPSGPPDVPQYPWGLSISLKNDSLDKLGLGGALPAAGDILEFFARAKVTNVHMDERVDSTTGETKCDCCVELQITAMLPHGDDAAANDDERTAARRSRFYDGDGVPG